MAQAVGRRPPIEESRVRFKTRPCRIGDGERRTGRDVTLTICIRMSIRLEIFTVIYFNCNCILEWCDPRTAPGLPVYGTEQQQDRRFSG